jgi:hypothetical protein
MQNNLFNSVLEINKTTADDLFRMYVLSSGSNTAVKSSEFIFPKYRIDNGNSEVKLRISEQEARIHYCFNLNNNKYNYLYSIETPTSRLYNFTKQKSENNSKPGRSALSDLSIYDSSKNKLLNVEFKAHNPEQRSYDKDIEKLIGEEVCGNWFHLLKNIDKGTIKSLNFKFKLAVEIAISKNQYVFDDNKNLWIFFFIVILDKKKIKYKTLNLNRLGDKNYFKELFPEKDDWESE